MPKDEFDPEDPMELCGVGLLTEEDTSEPMTECFIEEFLRMGYNAKQVLALFRNTHYTGMNMVMQNRGEQFVKDKIVEVFGWWKRPVSWAEGRTGVPPVITSDVTCDEQSSTACQRGTHQEKHEDRRDACATLTDPMGNEIPSLD
jgi:hypothetical protein